MCVCVRVRACVCMYVCVCLYKKKMDRYNRIRIESARVRGSNKDGSRS